MREWTLIFFRLFNCVNLTNLNFPGEKVLNPRSPVPRMQYMFFLKTIEMSKNITCKFKKFDFSRGEGPDPFFDPCMQCTS